MSDNKKARTVVVSIEELRTATLEVEIETGEDGIDSDILEAIAEKEIVRKYLKGELKDMLNDLCDRNICAHMKDMPDRSTWHGFDLSDYDGIGDDDRIKQVSLVIRDFDPDKYPRPKG